MSDWIVRFDGSAPASEGTREALCTLGNGVFGTRGAAAESKAGEIHYPGTYAAGVYNRLVSIIGGREMEQESLVNLPNWLPLTFRAEDGPWLDSVDVLDEAWTLDVRHAESTRTFRTRDADGRETTVAERRIVSMAAPHMAAIEWTLTPGNWSGTLTVQSCIDAGVENRNVTVHLPLEGRHLRLVDAGSHDEVCWVEVETSQSHIRCAQAARTTVAGGPVEERTVVREEEEIGHQLVVSATAENPLTVTKVVALYTSRDQAIADPLTAALEAVARAPDLATLVDEHRGAWERLWERWHVRVTTPDPGVQRILNLHTFHLLQTLSPHVADRDVAMGARGLHGEAYEGHVFWDDVFALPLMSLRDPDVARGSLLYRYRRLPAARHAAREAGHEGAMFPWQSGSDGREETPTQLFNPHSDHWMPDNSRRQRHVGLAIAYNTWRYFQATGDTAFLRSQGAELLVGIARFFAGVAERGDDGRHHIRGVMGPDEFHDGYPGTPGSGLDDNAYTNVLVSWLLDRVVEVHTLLAGPDGQWLWERLGVTPGEVERWDEIGRTLAVPFLEDGVIAQFAGYERLDELDWSSYRERYPRIGRLDLILESESDNTNRYKLTKQADTVMLLQLLTHEEVVALLGRLGYDVGSSDLARTIEHYLARTTHGSTLSRVAHGWALAQVDGERSWDLFLEALQSDIADTQGGTTREGVHLGVMAGTVDMIIRGYVGVRARGEVLWFDPHIPDRLEEAEFRLCHRGVWLDVLLSGGVLRVTSPGTQSRSARIGLRERLVELAPGESAELRVAS